MPHFLIPRSGINSNYAQAVHASPFLRELSVSGSLSAPPPPWWSSGGSWIPSLPQIRFTHLEAYSSGGGTTGSRSCIHTGAERSCVFLMCPWWPVARTSCCSLARNKQVRLDVTPVAELLEEPHKTSQRFNCCCDSTGFLYKLLGKHVIIGNSTDRSCTHILWGEIGYC